MCYSSAVSDRPKKTIGRKSAPKTDTSPKAEPAKAARVAKKDSAKEATGKAAKAPKSKARAFELRPAEAALVDALASRTGLAPAEVIARALQSYVAAVAPELRSAQPREESESESGGERLFLSIDGRPEVEVTQDELTLGSGEESDIRLNLPLIAPKHARILRREGKHLFEDLRSPRGSYRHGAPIDVRFLEDGDEIDLGGFLPVRFRVDRGGASS